MLPLPLNERVKRNKGPDHAITSGSVWSRLKKSGRGRWRRTIHNGYGDHEECNHMSQTTGARATTLEPQELVSYMTCWAATTYLVEKVSIRLWVILGGRKLRKSQPSTPDGLHSSAWKATTWWPFRLGAPWPEDPCNPHQKQRRGHGEWQNGAKKKWCFRTPVSSSGQQRRREKEHQDETAPYGTGISREPWWDRGAVHLNRTHKIIQGGNRKLVKCGVRHGKVLGLSHKVRKKKESAGTSTMWMPNTKTGHATR